MKFQEIDKKSLNGKSGIYKLYAGGHLYVGSSKNLYARLIEHRADLNQQKHDNDFLQKVFNKYSDSFEFDILEYCTPEERFNKEKYWINELKADINLQDPITLKPLNEESLKILQNGAKIARQIRTDKYLNNTEIDCYDYFGNFIKTVPNLEAAATLFQSNKTDVQKACGGYKKGIVVKGFRFKYHTSKISEQKFEINPNQLGRYFDFYYIDENGNEQIAFTSIKNVYKFFAEQVTKNKGQQIIIKPKLRKHCEEWKNLSEEANHIPSNLEIN